MAVEKDLLELDLYGLLGIGEKASEKEFHPVVLVPWQAAYDKVRRAKKQAAERTQKLDEKRKKVKLDLEAREREAQSQENEEEEMRITRSLEEEITRLREEGSRQLEEQQRLIREQIRLEREQHSQGRQERNGTEGKVTPKLKYGEVLNLVISSRKTGSAVVEFATVKAAEMAVKNEVGLINNPLKISWLEGQPRSYPSTVLSDSTSQPRTSQQQVHIVQQFLESCWSQAGEFPLDYKICGLASVTPGY
ncbi:DnaJ subfamily C member 17 [Willisornis vidua]|uniref:DnaJ subfamily C member 17 n=1 Tax=Willisornis vidua TaxID=1566151 RepID=A0ABQ9DFR0_9PASS|nr:DnaJ subfamily C member 17 [Willisornis vidua]